MGKVALPLYPLLAVSPLLLLLLLCFFFTSLPHASLKQFPVINIYSLGFPFFSLTLELDEIYVDLKQLANQTNILHNDVARLQIGLSKSRKVSMTFKLIYFNTKTIAIFLSKFVEAFRRPEKMCSPCLPKA